MILDRYRIDKDGKYYFHTFSNDVFNDSVWLENKGNFPTKEDGTYYTYYIEKEDGTILVDEAKEQKVVDLENIIKAKEQKLKDIEMITATVNTVEYDAHSRGRADLTGVIALANYKFIKALVSANPEFEIIYDSIYKQTKNWLGKDNKSHIVQIESIAEAGLQAYEKYAEVIGAKQ